MKSHYRVFAIISAILAVFASVIYSIGPETNYTGAARLLYNTGYIFTPCLGEKVIYSRGGIKFYFLPAKDTALKEETDKDGSLKIWLPNGVFIRVLLRESLPDIYRTAQKNISGSKRVPEIIKNKVLEQGPTLDTLPWIISEDVCPYYDKTSMLVADSISKLTLKSGLPAVMFTTRPDPMTGGDYMQHLVVWAPEKGFIEFTASAMSFTSASYSLRDIDSKDSTAKQGSPTPSKDKRTQCQLRAVTSTLELI